jgi:acyl-CoA thioesterase-1
MFAGSWSRRHFIAAALAGAYAAGSHAAGSSAANTAAPGKTILVVGDSLSAEYGLKRGTGWVPLLQARLEKEKLPARVLNASISGETTSGGRSRLPALLAQHQPAIVVIPLGANDALRGLPLGMTEDNLSQMTQAAQNAGAKVLLVGIQVPPNYGGDYANRFAGIYQKVAKSQGAALVPFMLRGIADDADPTRLFQADRIHPREEAQPLILDNIWPELKKLIAGAGDRKK